MLTRTTFTHPHPPIGASTDAHLVISFAGEDNPDVQRPKIAVVPVVDTSGSMGTDAKLTLVTRALAHLSEHLGAEDQLGLVTFASVIRTPVWLRRADAAGVADFTAALAGLRPGGGTNLYGAIAEGLAEVEDTAADTLVRVVVLTDGQANTGPVDERSLTTLLGGRPGHVSVSFLGVGYDCNHALLGALAEAGGGSYGFIETAADAPAVLGAEIGGLLDVEAHHLEVSVTTRPRYATLTSDSPLGLPGSRDGDTLRFTVSQVLRGATRNVVIPVQLHGTGRNHARPVTCADIEVTCVIDDQPVTFTAKPKVRFTDPGQAPDTDALALVDLAQLSAAIGAARSHAEAGDLAAAREMVSGLRLHSSVATTMRDQLVGSYNDVVTYNASSATLSSASAAVTGRLSGSSATFDALAARTIGSYQTDSQRRYAAQTLQSVAAPAHQGTGTDGPGDTAGDAAAETSDAAVRRADGGER